MSTLDVIVLTVLRITHILAGIMWVGAGLFMVFIIAPTMQKMRNGEIIQNILTHSRYSVYMSVSAGLTVLAGILLYVHVYSADWLSTAPGIVLTIGAVAGILAAGHGGMALAPTQAKLAALGQEIAAGGGRPSESQVVALNELQAKITQHGRISLILGLIAVIGMAGARYLIF